jgi:hypothetical protein
LSPLSTSIAPGTVGDHGFHNCVGLGGIPGAQDGNQSYAFDGFLRGFGHFNFLVVAALLA